MRNHYYISNKIKNKKIKSKKILQTYVIKDLKNVSFTLLFSLSILVYSSGDGAHQPSTSP